MEHGKIDRLNNTAVKDIHTLPVEDKYDIVLNALVALCIEVAMHDNVPDDIARQLATTGQMIVGLGRDVEEAINHGEDCQCYQKLRDLLSLDVAEQMMNAPAPTSDLPAEAVEEIRRVISQFLPGREVEIINGLPPELTGKRRRPNVRAFFREVTDPETGEVYIVDQNGEKV